ncbi:hypothetical protein NKG94_21035 [Micromonospora sp. M12]
MLLGSVAAGYVATAAEPDRTPPPVTGPQAVTLAPGPRLLAITDRHVSSVATTDPPGRVPSPAWSASGCTPRPAPVSA